MHQALDCQRYALEFDADYRSVSQLPERYMLFVAERVTGRDYKNQSELADWSSRYLEGKYRDRFIASLISKSFRCPSDLEAIQAARERQFKDLDQEAARQQIIDNIYGFLSKRLKTAKILSQGKVELDLVFQSDGSVDLQYDEVEDDTRAIQHEISRAFHDMGPILGVIWYEEQHLVLPEPYRLKVRLSR
ncbi:MAG: hypothetical protein EBW81_09240 [Gammaproteobacteria bacterium]|nr:hypothetical protein [Gammaproteobacteria bacterium]